MIRQPFTLTPSQVRRDLRHGFSLLELLVVVTIMGILASLAMMGFKGIVTSNGVGRAVNDVTGILGQARSYAMANNTYVFCGFAEVDAISSSPTSPLPAGTGKLVVCAVASVDGTNNFTSGGVWRGNSNLTPIMKVWQSPGLHLSDFSSLSTTTGAMAARQPILASASLGNSAVGTNVEFTWPLSGAATYQFSKVICFDSQGSAYIQSTASPTGIPQWLEIALQPANGNAVPATPSNIAQGDIASLEVDGTTGAVQIFRP